MKKSQSKINKNKIRHTLCIPPILSISSILSLCILSLPIISSISTSALTYQDSTNVDFTINPTINLTLSGDSGTDLIIDNLAPGSASDSNIITAAVSTNAGWGYYLSATVNTSTTNTNLTHETSESNVFTNLSSNKASLSDFSDNTWGYSYCNSTTSIVNCDNSTNWVSGDTGSAITGYNGLPLDNNDSGSTGIKLLNPNSYASSGSVQFKIGAKASSTQASGTYTGTINFYVVTTPEPKTISNSTYLQEVEECLSTLPEEQVYTLKDSRDNQEYKVAKLKDGKCWMVENLNLAGGTALSATDTDVSSDYIANFTTSNNLTKDDTNNTIVLPASSTTGFDQNNYSYVFNSSNKTDNCAALGCYSYYSWDVATLGSGRNISTDNTDAPYSICSKGWHLPNTRTGTDSSSDFRALMIAYGGSASIETYDSSTNPTGIDMYHDIGPTSIPAFLLSGNYNNSLPGYNGSAGFYWSSTSDSTNTSVSRLLDIRPNNKVSPTSRGNRYYGYSIRCLFSSQ